MNKEYTICLKLSFNIHHTFYDFIQIHKNNNSMLLCSIMNLRSIHIKFLCDEFF